MARADVSVAARLEAPADVPGGAAVTLSTSRLAALHAHLRRASAAIGDDAVRCALRPAVRAYRVIDAGLPQSIRLPSGDERIEHGAQDRSVRERYWRLLEAEVFASSTIDDLRQRGARMTTPIAGQVRADTVLARVADALALGWSGYGREIWPAASTELAERIRWWADVVAPRSSAMVAALRRALAVSDATPVPRVLVVPRGADRDAVTYRTLGGPLIVAEVGRHRGADLVEVIFQAIAHALDWVAPGAGTLGTLRASLRAAAIPAETVERTVQATIFALVASATRDQFDALQMDVEERYGAYERGPRRFHEAVDEPVRALQAGRVDAAGFAKWVTQAVGRG